MLPPAKKKKKDSPGIRLHPSTEHGCTRQIGSATYIQEAGWRSNPCRPEDHAPVMCYCDSIYKSYHSLHVWPRLHCRCRYSVNGVVLKRPFGGSSRPSLYISSPCWRQPLGWNPALAHITIPVKPQALDAQLDEFFLHTPAPPPGLQR